MIKYFHYFLSFDIMIGGSAKFSVKDLYYKVLQMKKKTGNFLVASRFEYFCRGGCTEILCKSPEFRASVADEKSN